jgi:hypothetical protein
MNWRKGLWRLWCALSLCWVISIGVYAFVHQQVEEGIGVEMFGDVDAGAKTRAKYVKEYAPLVILPPIVTLGLGLLGVWVVSGFARKGEGG